MDTTRIKWIDICKGLGIIFVIYAHGLNGDSIRFFFYAFHMPLFFFLSGIIFHHKKHEHLLPFLQKNIKSILIPYLFFAFLSYFLWLTNQKNLNLSFSLIIQHLSGVFYGNGNNRLLFFNVVLWFLPCLFLTKTIFFSVTGFIKKTKFLLLSLVIFSMAGYFMYLFFPEVKLPFGLESALTGIVFFGAGFLWNENSEKATAIFKKHSNLLFIFFLILMIIFAVINYNIYGTQIDLRLNRLNNFFFFYIAAFSGILSFVALSIKLHKNFLLEKLGENSLTLFVFHLIVFSYFSRFLRMFIEPETIEKFRNLYFAPLYTVFSIVLILFLLFIYKKIKIRILSSQ